ncbi:SGNH/GDSL hydrolase family protein [Marinilactibacillus sp. Marseille-P9653]|uniref:SGNH/GDSL hydrolase family protein n=1 Tax=Marinilactibacillus sp. Marseille-P9653 TaxID=2866583 RepID=UPI001CE43E22|nr:SGNH/GDSL hydrolase family protein [Marinilactibacillus sp. Marseille-P9653]
MKIKPQDKILFIGDSITDVDRDRSNPNDLGKGYPLMVAAELQAGLPEEKLTFYNKGIAGDKVVDLKARWEEDCLDLNPDIVSILVGINDSSHQLNLNQRMDQNAIEQFEEDYRFLLKSLIQRTDARIVLIEPFVLPYPKERIELREDLDQRIQIVRKMAREYQTDLIPLDGLFSAQGVKYGYPYYTGEDGIHPTVAGHGLIKEAWINQIEF